MQPALGVSKNQKREEKKFQKSVNLYKIEYPKAIKLCKEISYLHDFTNIFSNINQDVFYDDCHLKPKYQNIVSDSLVSLIINNKYL